MATTVPTRGATWTDKETECLLDVWGEECIQAELEGAKHNHKVYDMISQEMGGKGFERDGKQCVQKVKKLKAKYRTVLDNNNRSGRGQKDWKFFNRMHEILGHRPASRPPVLLQSVAKKKVLSAPRDDAQPSCSSSMQDSEESDIEVDTDLSASVVDDKIDKENGSQQRDIASEDNSDASESLLQPPPPPGKRPKRLKKNKTEKAIDGAISNFIDFMKQSDAVFIKMEQERMKKQAADREAMLKLQSDLEQERLQMEERMCRKERAHEFNMMHMICQMMGNQQINTAMPPPAMMQGSTTAMSPPTMYRSMCTSPLSETFSPPGTSEPPSASDIPPFSKFIPYQP